MILTGTMMLPDGPARVRLTDGWLRVEDGHIVEVREGAFHNAADAGGPGWLIAPGFVDAHLHLPQFGAIGSAGLGLLDWLRDVIFPAEARWADADTARADTRRAIGQLQAVGTTSFAGYATSHAASALAALDEAARLNVRCAVGLVGMDQQGPPELTRPTEVMLAEARNFARAAADRPNPGRAVASLAPRFAIACSADLLAGLAELAKQFDLPVQTHLAETEPECREVARLHAGRRYLDVYAHAGLLGERTVFAHAIHVSDDDRARLAGARATVCHCPTSNAFLASGAMDLAAMLDAGVPVALGSDLAAGPDLPMPRVARAMADTARSLGHPAPDPAECFAQITSVNADQLGWASVGRVAPGAEADLLLFKPTDGWAHAPDPLGALLYGWDDRWLQRVILDGLPAWHA